MPSPQPNRKGGGAAAVAASPASPTSPSKSVEAILAEKRAAAEALQAVANNLHAELLKRGIDALVPQPGHSGSKVRLPLQHFDNLSLESMPPDEWVKRSRRAYGKRANAVLLVPLADEPGYSQLLPGRVVDYDAATGLFKASPSGVDGRILEDLEQQLPRLSVMFLLEKVETFAQRVADAYKSRDECEAALLFSFYVKNMPTADVRTLNESQVARLLERALTTMRLRASTVDPNPLVDEVKLDYAHSVNGMLLHEGLQRPPLSEKPFAKHLLPPPPPPVPELGVIQIAENLSPLSKPSFTAISSLVMPQVVLALQAAQTECLQLQRLSLFNLSLAHTVRLDDFEQLQTQHTVRTTQFLVESWQKAIKTVVVKAMSGVDPEKWDAPCPPPATFTDGDDDDDGAAKGTDQISAADFLLEQSLMSSGAVEQTNLVELPRPDTRAFRLMRAVNLRMADAIRYMGQDSMRTYCAFLSEHFARRGVLLEPDNLLYLLYLLDVKTDGGVLDYSDTPSLFVTVVAQLLDDAISAIGDVREIDLFDKSVSVPLTLHPLSTVSAGEDEVRDLRDGLVAQAEDSIVALAEFLDSMRAHEELLQRDEAAYVRAFEESKKDPPSLAELKDKVAAERAHKAQLEAQLPNRVLIGTYLVNTETLKATILDKFDRTCELLLQLICERARAMSADVMAKFEEMFGQLQEQPKDIEKLTEISEFIATVQTASEELQADIDKMTEHYEVLEELQFETPQEDFTARWETFHWPLRLKLKQEECYKMMEEDRQLFNKEMEQQQQQFDLAVAELAERVSEFGKHTDLGRITKVVAMVKDIEKALKDFEERAATFNKREALFNKDATDYEILQRINKDFEPYRDMWINAAEWQKWARDWLDGPMINLDPDAVERDYTNSSRVMAKATKTFKDSPVGNIAKQIKAEMDVFRPFLPVVTSLRNPGMRDRHWEALTADLGMPLKVDDVFTLRTATDTMKLHEPKTLERVQKVCERALKEYTIEKALNDMEAAWQPQDFEVMAYRNTGTSVIKLSEEVNTLLDDNIVLTQQFSFSPYKGPFEERIADWERRLRLVQEVTSEWLGCQRNWMYLQPIFDSEDIQRQLPAEAKRFSNVDRLWRKTLDRVGKAPKIIAFCNDDELLEQWIKSNNELERVQKNLSDYLETKRAAFARFYFLSNDELISILSQTKDPNAVQPHLRKCFEAVFAVTMKGKDCAMTDMISPEKEVVPFVTTIYPKGSVEVWMGVIEEMMRLSVRKLVEDALGEYKVQQRGAFMLSHSSQAAIAISSFYWTLGIEENMNRAGSKGVEDYYQEMLGQLKELSLLVRTKLNKLQNKVMSALIVIEVHARDVVERLIEGKCSAISDFEWVSQLRYYWENTPNSPAMKDWGGRRNLGEQNMIVRMVQCNYPYGYEYLGASARLVVTPLTDRCYMTLMGAMHIKLGGAPAGPAGTGKTESVKDLAKALAKQCVVFNCSDGLDYKAMGKFFKGLSTAGAWACFDEFNRIDIEVLSVVAQQMLTIVNACIQEKEWFDFEGTNVKLDSTTSNFITMNPGYAGRSELPDNLKALYRPMAMMVPDYALIAEIRLFSFGFDKSKPLAQKLVGTFRLSSEQLSSQDHYDFGMRAVNTVIQAAGNLKKDYPEMEEDLQMLRAMRDSNLPKFLRDDILLFRAIIKDLFPGVVEPNAVYAKLEAELASVAKEMGLQVPVDFTVKCIQLYEMTTVRHGMMTVGPSGGGKTKVLRVLQSAMSRCKDDKGEWISGFEKVRVYKLNPKSITMNQLYGSFDLATGEWTDGIGAVLIRHISQPDTNETGVTQENIKWMMFDGPVDAIWIENMNTVLDDNKKLCLNSGEIIPLAETNRVMFEVEDLSVASPATVSRCGMIYIEPAYLLPDRLKPESATSTPLIKSWLEALKNPLDKHAAALSSLFNQYIVPMTELLRLEMRQPIAAVMPNTVMGVMRLIDCLFLPYMIDPNAEPNPEADKAKIEAMPKLIEPLFFMALIWGVGGTTDEAGRAKFDVTLRDLIKKNGTKVGLPPGDTVYDYTYIAETSTWAKWGTIITPYEIPQKTDFQAEYPSLIVPTTASVCYTYLLDTLLKGKKHTLVVGSTGTAKTVVVQQKLTRGLEQKYLGSGPLPGFEPIMMAFAAQTSANQTQDILDSKFDKRRQGVDKDTGLQYTMWGPMLGKQFAIFIDDFNMPKRETYGAQPPIEIVRQLVEGGWYDRKIFRMRQIVDCTLIGAMGPPGGGRQIMSNRMIRHMHMLTFTDLSSNEISMIFSTITSAFMKFTFGDELVSVAGQVVQATVAIYQAALGYLRPTPAKPHYTFNLRDVSKVVQGVLMADKRAKKEGTKMEDIVRIWVHESSRVFSDRLINDEDRKWFLEQVKDQTQAAFKKGYSSIVSVDDGKLLYCDFLQSADPTIYEEVTDLARLSQKMNESLGEYNEMNVPMNLVLFADAISHVCRISRVLRQPSGNCLLLGVGGSGRQSLTRLACHLADFKCFQIEITKNYRTLEWREDLKTVLRMAGIELRPVVFLFVDTQITDEIFLENINNILSAGEVPNLFEDADMGPIFDKMTPLCLQAGVPANKTNLSSMFIKMCKKFLKIVLAMSPLGDDYANRIRQFPSLINCSTIDWFSPWPPEALQAVARTLMVKEAEQNDAKTFDGIVDMCTFMHNSVRVKSQAFLEEMRRYNYVTSTSYLELINVIKLVVVLRADKLNMKLRGLTVGLDKLKATKTIIADLKQKLADNQPVLERTKVEVGEQQIQIAKDKEDAQVVKAEAEVSSAAANKKSAECAGIKASAEAGLAEALPALDAAVKCLAKLDKSQIVEVKALKKPPEGVRTTLMAVAIMFEIKSVKIPDPDNPQKKIDDYWGPASKMLNDLGPDKFKQALIDFDKDNISPKVIANIDPVCAMETFTPEAIVKVSVACEAMCLWVHAMRKYYYVALEVEPKRKQLAAAEIELGEATASKRAAEAKLDAVTKRVAALEAALKAAVEKMASLEAEVAKCTVQLVNADKLILGLSGEAKSWEEMVVVLKEQVQNVTGDVLVCAGAISYMGPFTAPYRASLTSEWLAQLKKVGIRYTADCSLNKILADPVKVRQWNMDGLPADAFSVENGIIMSITKRWPLMIDPQGQANRFLKLSQAKMQIKTVKASDSAKKVVQTLEMAIRLGTPMLIENVVESLDPFLDPVLANQTYKDSSGSLVIKLGENVIPFHSDFKFALTTVIPNPHYAPEVSVKVALLNFAITQGGLEDQLLVSTVETERPDLAEKKAELVVQSAANKAKLQELQDEILYLLANSQGDILDDTNLIDTLGVSKVTTDEINIAVAEAEIAEKEIDETRAKYIPVAVRAAILFFCIADLAMVDPMYQYSLNWFKQLFVEGIRKAPASEDLNVRIENLNNFETYLLYTNICRSIFEEHKLMFSFLLAIKIQMGYNKVDPGEWRFLLSGGKLNDLSKKPDADWLTPGVWLEFINLAQLPAFRGIDDHVASNLEAWRKVYDSVNPQLDQFPAPWQAKCDVMGRMLVLRALRPDKCVPAVQLYVEAMLGRRFIEPPPFDLAAAFGDSSVSLPLIFILVSGADPVKGLIQYAELSGMGEKIDYISLGQGQGPKAEALIKGGKDGGRWVLLMNCHLFVSWMPQLEREVEGIDPNKTDPSFRLWLTSMPSAKFPVSVLQNGVKMTNEPPKGLRANLRATFAAIPEEVFESTKRPADWRKIMFGLLLHCAVILERRKFGPLGWNIPYQFTDGDRDMVIKQTEMLVNDYDEIPYKVITSLTTEVNYGGRVTDSWDRRTSNALLIPFCNIDVTKPDYKFSANGIYRSIPGETKEDYMKYLNDLPVNAPPEIFGLHDNAEITCAVNETKNLFNVVLSLQPRASSGGGKSREQLLDELAKDIFEQMPAPFNLEKVSDAYPTTYTESMNTVLQQECIRYNKVINKVSASLRDVRKGLKGEVVMTAELDTMGTSLFNNQVPEMWAKVAYPSLKPLASWVPDLLKRIGYIQLWFDEGKPPSFWISGFYFPQAFITGVMQNHARKYQLPIDTITYGYDMRDETVEQIKISGPADDGAFIYGLFIEGARWDMKSHLLAESRPKELFTELPLIHLLPVANRKRPEGGFYFCPVYKTSSRFGVLSTTGHSTNFVMSIEIPSNVPQEHWIKRGTAALSMLNF